MNVNITPDGTVYGIEPKQRAHSPTAPPCGGELQLLNANAQLEAEDDGRLVVINETLGKRLELPLAVREAPAKYKTKKRTQA
ncbi:MAG: hypothetical protein R6V76_11300 [Desulfobacterales bacterium]